MIRGKDLSNNNTLHNSTPKELLSLLLDNTEQTFILVDRDLKVVVYNKTAEILSLEIGKVHIHAGMTIMELAKPERHDILRGIYQKVFEGETLESLVPYGSEEHPMYLHTIFKPARNSESVIIGAVVNVRDVTSTILAEQQLQKSEQQYKELFNNNPLPMWTYDMETLQFLHVNEAAIFHYGYTREEFLNMSIRDIRPPEDVSDMERIAYAKLESFKGNWRHKKKNGEIIYVEVSSHEIVTEGRKAKLVLANDVTDRINSQEKLLQSEAKYLTLFQNSPLPCFLYDPVTHAYLDVNQAAIDCYGYTREEFLRMKVQELSIPHDAKNIAKNLVDLGSRPFKGVWKHVRKNGEIIVVDITSTEIIFDGKKARLTIATDVTEKQRTEEQIKKSNERFTLATRASFDAIWDADILANTITWGEGFEKLFGYEAGESMLSNSSWEKNLHPEDKDRIINSYEAALKDPFAGFWTSQYRFMRANGSVAYVIDKSVIIRENGKPIRVVGAMQDITELKLKEEELLKSNERFYFASQSTSDIIWDLDIINESILWAETYHHILGHDLAPDGLMMLENCFKNFHPDDKERVIQKLTNSFSDSRKTLWMDEFRYRRKNGSYAFVQDRGFIIRDENGVAIRMIGAMKDISEQNYQEKMLNLELSIYELSAKQYIPFTNVVEELLRGIERLHPHMHCSVHLVNRNGSITCLAAPSLPADIMRLSEGAHVAGAQFPPARSIQTRKTEVVRDINADPTWAACGVALRVAGYRSCWSVPLLQSDGKVMGSFEVYYKNDDTPGENEWKIILRFQNLLRILVENFKSVEETRISNERYDIVARATHDSIWDWDLAKGELYRDPEGVKKVYGISEPSTISHINKWLSHIHPDDLNRVQQIISDILKTKDQDIFDLEYRFRADDGTYSDIYDRGMIIRNNEGEPYRMIGAAQNITERKRLEHELLMQEVTRQKAMSQVVIDTQESERAEIGKELHDNVNQLLTTTKLYLELAKANAELKDEMIDKSSDNIVYIINEIRKISRALMLPSLGDLGLVDSVADLVESLNSTKKIRIEFEENGIKEEYLSENQKLILFRIVQEALNNTINHSGASKASIHLEENDRIISLTVRDNGKGFDTEKFRKGVGLNNIQNRVSLFNGTLLINASPGRGCELVVKIPLSQPKL